MAMTRGIIRMTEGGRVSMPHLYLTYKLPSRNAQIFRKYMTNKAYERSPYDHICIIVDDVDFRQQSLNQ